jgi:hypothetical protein
MEHHFSLKFREVSKKTSIRSRYNALTANEQVKLGYLRSAIAIFAVKMKLAKKKEDKERFYRQMKIYLLGYCKIKIDFGNPLERPFRRKISIAEFDESYCKTFFRFRKNDLRRLFQLLNFPVMVRFDNRGKMEGEEVFLRGLYELCQGRTKHRIAEIFGRHPSDQSRAFAWFVDHIYSNFHHLVHDNLEWWYRSGLIRQSAHAIGRKIGREDNAFALFIDCNCMSTNRPGGGPSEEGPEVERWSPLIEEAFYSGWKSVDGLKHQTIDCALGMTVDMTGPTSFRRNELILLIESHINERLRNLCVEDENDPIDYCIFGDSAYVIMSNLGTYIKKIDRELTAEEEDWNSAMKNVRLAIDWNYMVTKTLFNYVGNEGKLKLLEREAVARIYTVATLFRNFFVACGQGQSITYFNLITPDNLLEAYIRQEYNFSEIRYDNEQ